MAKARFVYVTYIAATPERVFAALTEPEFTRKYWGAENVSNWKPGSTWEHWRTDGEKTLAMVGEVVEHVPPRRMVWTWSLPSDAKDRARHSRVRFEIETVGAMARLIVTHDELEPGSEMLARISSGWPRVLSSMKSLLETGRPLATWAERCPS